MERSWRMLFLEGFPGLWMSCLPQMCWESVSSRWGATDGHMVALALHRRCRARAAAEAPASLPALPAPTLCFPSGLPSHPVRLDTLALAKKLSGRNWELGYCPPEAGIFFVLQQIQISVLLLTEKRKKKKIPTTLRRLLKTCSPTLRGRHFLFCTWLALASGPVLPK